MKPLENLTAHELYIVHNGILEKAYNRLHDRGHHDIADRLQALALEEQGAWILHSVIQSALETAYLDQSTEPNNQ